MLTRVGRLFLKVLLDPAKVAKASLIWVYFNSHLRLQPSISGSGAFSETLFEKCIPMARVRIPVSRKSRKVPGSNAWTCLSSFFFSEETGFTFFFYAHILCTAQDLGGQILCDPLPRSCAAHRIRQTISCAQPATSCAPHRISGPNLQDVAVISCATL